jgi:hypothetical protein
MHATSSEIKVFVKRHQTIQKKKKKRQIERHAIGRTQGDNPVYLVFNRFCSKQTNKHITKQRYNSDDVDPQQLKITFNTLTRLQDLQQQQTALLTIQFALIALTFTNKQ